MSTQNWSRQNGNGKILTVQDREIRDMLVSGEEVLLKARLHGALYWKSVAVLIFALFLYLFIPVFTVLFGVVGILMLCVAILTKHYTLLVVTSKRILARQGLLQMDVVDIRLSKVESIDLERMLLGHIFGYASVVVMGTGQRLIRVPFVANAEAFRRFYNELVLSAEGNDEVAQELKNNPDSVQQEEKQKPSRAPRSRRKTTSSESNL